MHPLKRMIFGFIEMCVKLCSPESAPLLFYLESMENLIQSPVLLNSDQILDLIVCS